ncbi:MAG: TerB family tellurite resistance protein [Acidobacteriota bacterium]|nr:TerB family tellurite resistance protein [Acidobacteriota bacterium]
MIGKALLTWLGGGGEVAESDALVRAAAALDGVPPERARYVAAFAYLLARVAAVDSQVSPDEMDLMHRVVQREADLSDEEAKVIVDLALGDALRFAGTHNLDVTREFMTLATAEQRLGLLRCLFAVSAADDSVELAEDNEIRRISRELKIEHGDFIGARAEVRAHLKVLRLP